MRLAAYGPLATGEGRILEVEALRSVGASPGMLVVRFKGIRDRDGAEALKGAELGVARSQLPPPEDEDEFYQADLVGLSALDPAGQVLGRVAAVVNFGAGDLLEIKPSRGESFYLAFTRQNVPSVEIALGRLTIFPPLEVLDEGGELDEREEGHSGHE